MKRRKIDWSKDGLKFVLSRGIPLIVVGSITILVLHPGIWIGFLLSIIHFLLVYFIGTIVCHILFHKGIMDVIRFGYEPQLTITDYETEEKEETENK